MSSHVHREFAGQFESTNLSRDDLGREIGRTFSPSPKRGIRKTVTRKWLRRDLAVTMDVIL